jgi:hypothetical protein
MIKSRVAISFSGSDLVKWTQRPPHGGYRKETFGCHPANGRDRRYGLPKLNERGIFFHQSIAIVFFGRIM